MEDTFKIIKANDKKVTIYKLYINSKLSIKKFQCRKVVKRYSIIKTLGQGSFSKVKLAIKNDTNEHFAIKVLKKKLLKKQIQFFKSSSRGIFKNFLKITLNSNFHKDAIKQMLSKMF